MSAFHGRRILCFAAWLIAARVEAAGAPDPLEPLYRRAAEDLRQGRPLVATVHVALCDNQSLHCGGGGLGNGDRPRRNLYWGGGAGLRAVFDLARGWRRIHLDSGDGERVLERVVYRRFVATPSARWRRLGVSTGFEVLLVGLAYRGSQIGEAHRAFVDQVARERGLSVELAGGRRVRAGGLGHLVGYAGHNHLLDDLAFAFPERDRERPLAYFALSCLNAGHLGPRYCGSPARAVMLTRSLMYPGAFTVVGLLRALTSAATDREVFEAGAADYARMQGRPEAVIRAAFIHEGAPRFRRLFPGCRSRERGPARPGSAGQAGGGS